MFNAFILISLFYCFIGLRVVHQLVTHWRATWDRTFTPSDRGLVDQAAFFILLPISVALHELGHATAIWSFGGHVTDFGFFVFAGYVSYDSPFTNVQHILVAFAGPFVSWLLAVLAVAFVLLKRPPMRAAYNELLLQFAVLDIVNVLIFYPLLDFATGLEGDWSQMYFGHVPALSAAILVWHLGTLAVGYWAWKNPGMRARFAALTGSPTGAQRAVFGGFRRGPLPEVSLSASEQALREAASRVASGWPQPVSGQLQRRGNESVLILAWEDNGLRRAVLAWIQPDDIDLWGTVEPLATAARAPTAVPLDHHRLAAVGEIEPLRRHISRLPATASADELTLALRVAMEEVSAWQPAARVGDGG